MKARSLFCSPSLFLLVVAGGLTCVSISPLALVAAERATAVAGETDERPPLAEAATNPDDGDKPEAQRPPGRKLTWLGVSADEASEALASQLALPPGVGLLVDYVEADSPAAKAGLKKNDLLVEFEGQSLVHPAQLRKLVQARKEGDAVKLVYYRGGKRESVTATLGTTSAGLGLAGGESAWRGDLRELQRQLRDAPWGEEFRRGMETFRETLREQIGPEQRRALSEQIREAAQQAARAAREAAESGARAAREAMQTATNNGLRELRKALEELERNGMGVSRDARVTVHSSNSEVKTMVQADDSGTYVLIKQPKPHLTVHGKDGQLRFDGPVSTVDERAKVPRDIWEKVEPMFDKLER